MATVGHRGLCAVGHSAVGIDHTVDGVCCVTMGIVKSCQQFRISRSSVAGRKCWQLIQNFFKIISKVANQREVQVGQVKESGCCCCRAIAKEQTVVKCD